MKVAGNRALNREPTHAINLIALAGMNAERPLAPHQMIIEVTLEAELDRHRAITDANLGFHKIIISLHELTDNERFFAFGIDLLHALEGNVDHQLRVYPASSSPDWHAENHPA